MKRKPKPAPAPWRNRIVESGQVDPRQLAAHPLNFRVHSAHQSDVLASALQDVGIVQSIVISKRTGRILDGHLRCALAIEQNQPLLPANWVDVDEKEEQLIIASLDAITGLADTDYDKLQHILSGVNSADLGLSEFLAELSEQAAHFTMSSVSDGGSSASSRTGDSDPSRQVKAVLYMDQIQIFEAALKATGERNRGDALLIVCKAYLDA